MLSGVNLHAVALNNVNPLSNLLPDMCAAPMITLSSDEVTMSGTVRIVVRTKLVKMVMAIDGAPVGVIVGVKVGKAEGALVGMLLGVALGV